MQGAEWEEHEDHTVANRKEDDEEYSLCDEH
jgi:hypothetical protein